MTQKNNSGPNHPHKKVRDFVAAPKNVQLRELQDEPMFIMHLDDPDEDLQLSAVSADPFALIHIDKPTETVQLVAAAIPDGWSALRHCVDKPGGISKRARQLGEVRCGRALPF